MAVPLYLWFIKTFMLIYGYATLPFYALLQRPWRYWHWRNEVVRLDPEDPFSAYTTSPAVYPHSPDINTADKMFRSATGKYSSRKSLGSRAILKETMERQLGGRIFRKIHLSPEFKWLSFSNVEAKVEQLTQCILALGIKPAEAISFFAETSLEWFLMANACFRTSITVITLYSSLREEEIVHALNETKTRCLVTTSSLLMRIRALLIKVEDISKVIYFEMNGERNIIDLERNVSLIPFAHFETLATNIQDIPEVRPPQPNDLAVIMYTSGSTDNPKGVLLSHFNLTRISNEVSLILNDNAENIHLAFLPLAHIMELGLELGLFASGGAIAYSNPHTITNTSTAVPEGQLGDAILAKPTFIAVVPNIAETIRKKIIKHIERQEPMTQIILNYFIHYKIEWYRRGYDTPIINRLFFFEMAACLGGRVRVMLNGGASLIPDSQEFLQAVLNTRIIQGYGLSETTGVGTLQSIFDRTVGHVGAPRPGTYIKLIDWPEGNYSIYDEPNSRGEIIIGGPSVSCGYYNNDEQTIATFKYERRMQWMRTGDIGEQQSEGRIKIIDRKKNIVKNQSGEYISLEKIESILKSCSLVENACVCCNDFYAFLVALVVPNPEELQALAKNKSKDWTNWKLICSDPFIGKDAKLVIWTHCLNKLPRNNIPLKIQICQERWDPEAGLVTPTLKLRRHAICEYYKHDIERMFNPLTVGPPAIEERVPESI